MNVQNFGCQSPGLDPRIYGADAKLKAKPHDLCLFCCFMSQSTAMVMAGRSVYLTTLFPGQA